MCAHDAIIALTESFDFSMLLAKKNYRLKTNLASIATCFNRAYSLDYILNSLGELRRQELGKEDVKKKSDAKKRHVDFTKKVITPDYLIQHFLDGDLERIKKSTLSDVHHLFKKSEVSLQWVAGSYNDIPDVKYNILKENNETMASRRNLEYTESKLFHKSGKTSFGIRPDLLRPLPEVLFLGHTNAGKSSLINSLLSRRILSNEMKENLARVSKKPGFTKTLNCYKIGNRIRLVDTPGYGEYGIESQGKAVIEYIKNRSLLRRVFLVIDSVRGILEEDVQIIHFLMAQGVSFEILFTKVDEIIDKNMPKFLKLKNFSNYSKDEFADESIKRRIDEGNAKVIQYYQRMVDDYELLNIPTLPRLLFSNSITNFYVKKQYGFDDIRCEILQACSLSHF